MANRYTRISSISISREASRLGSRAILALSLGACLPLVGCDTGKVPEPEKRPTTAAAGATGTATQAVGSAAGAGGAAAEKARIPLRQPEYRKVAAKPVAPVKAAPGDPVAGKFGMEDALKGLAGSGTQLFADLETSVGTLQCELYPDKAPLTVANFVGLARGVRPWKQADKWVKKPLYDGLVFHRVVKGFMIQGGDPNKDGSGGPGYEIPDEIWEDAHHDAPGLLCMANRGPNTNGSQFFIMDGSAPHLDGGYTIFGKCGPTDVIQKLSSSPTVGDRAVDPPEIKKVTVRRAG
jgi:peptidyl-prolyl cis-trans isomerase A (cyclophilin A)